MTTSTSLSGGLASPSAPVKGSFPLDHLSECRAFARAYRECLTKSSGVTNGCRRETKAYLECRMQRGLMAKEKWDALGLSRDTIAGEVGGGANDGSSQKQPSFVAGAKLAKRRREKANDAPKDPT